MLRSEALTEQISDLLIECTGGATLAAGTPVPQANIVVQFNSTVTSRVLNSNVGGYPALDALLFIDDPQSGLTAPVSGWGPAAQQVLCATPAAGCAQYTGRVDPSTGTSYSATGVPVALNTAGVYPASASNNTATTNVFQALLTGSSQITFFNVPILPPGASGITRTFRITNVRLNASALSSAFGQAVASISTNNYSALPITNSTPAVGYVQPGLGTVSVTAGGSPFSSCSSANRSLAATINIPENTSFGTAFKPRVAPQSTVSDSNLLPGTAQNLTSQYAPGEVYNSESGLIFQNLTGLGGTAGLAEFGTRLKIAISNVPAGATVYVPTTVKTALGSGSYTYAGLVTAEATADGTSFPAGGTLDASGTTLVALPSSGIAVYEILGTNSSAVETLKIPVYVSSSAGHLAAGTARVVVSLAPNPTDGAFSASTGVNAQSFDDGYTIPRFLDTGGFQNLFTTTNPEKCVVPSTDPLSCTSQAAGTPQLRSEGLAEQTGDILITCSGGATLATGTTIPQANIVVQFNASVTSRVLNSNVNGYPALDSLLFIDDPQSGLSAPVVNWGPAAPQNLCANPASGCVQYVGRVDPYTGDAEGGGVNVALDTAGTYYASAGKAATTNVYQALLTGPNQITFFGIPVLPPAAVGISRAFRITNVRLNASALGSSFGQAVAFISTNNYSALPISNPSPVVGYVQPGLGTVSVTAVNSPYAVCIAQTKGGATWQAATVNIPENFGTAFKTRVVPQTTVADGNLLAGTLQNLTSQFAPGATFNSESGLIFQNLSGQGAVAGLADFGTRLKLKISNLPAGATVYLPTTVKTAGATGYTYAGLVTSETVSDGTSFPSAGTLDASGGTYAALPSTGIAVYEILGANASLVETLQIPVFVTYTKNQVDPGTAKVAVSLAPNPTDGAFSASNSIYAQPFDAGYTIPRFLDTSVSRNLFTTQLCTTSLLYPYVTSAGGFDTGIAVANATSDPFGTLAQAGTCSIYFYGSNAPSTNPYVTSPLATGTTTAVLASSVAPSFTGYAISVCNFQLAHGFAFVSDLGARSLAMGYLPLVMGNADNSTARATVSPANEFLAN
jgi:hypothetical protein